MDEINIIVTDIVETINVTVTEPAANIINILINDYVQVILVA